MARFYKEFVERIIVALIILMQVEKDTSKDVIIQNLKKYKADNPDDADIIYRAMMNYFDSRPGDETHIASEEVLLGALGQMKKTKQHDTDLIETIVQALKLPHSAHYFHLGHLKTLREAILRPDEAAKWRKTVLESNLKCKCGHQFSSYEAVVTHASGDGTYELRCHRCSKPQMVACDRCGEAFLILDKNVPIKAECGCHKKPKAAPATEEAAGPQAPPPPRRTRTFTQTLRDLTPHPTPATMEELNRLYTEARVPFGPADGNGGF